MTDLDDAQWFNDYGSCRNCGKPANGEVVGTRNQSMGKYCRKCGHSRVTKAKKARERQSEHLKGNTP